MGGVGWYSRAGEGISLLVGLCMIRSLVFGGVDRSCEGIMERSLGSRVGCNACERLGGWSRVGGFGVLGV